ncbi:WXG100 family type VII secretion target [Butyrivibrio sp. ob235]|uniref:WXG100 family type VII secretion target n=1 Tax=Butyrivibrio sp. ob235 TaxID=1761780 RepID=UPI0008BC2CFD|nr:WXG100 family type VII secretion target [Butyrivibrio sp. ob235]SEM28425.1 WXG100 family type VII secretion target [Butyrivibrio sp. ob235]
MADVNIQVDVKKLRALAESVDKVQTELRESCYSAKGQIDSLKNIWTGEAANTYQTSFQKLMDECNEALTTMGKMVNSLYDSADRYDQVAKDLKNSKDIPKLPTNVFS